MPDEGTVMPTATTTGPGRAAASSEQETMHGWELHVTNRQRDAYYAVLVLRASVIVAYGRRGAKCQATVHRRGALEAALRKAQAMTDDKVSEGYQVTRDHTVTEVPAAVVSRAMSDDRQAATAAIRDLLQAFRSASAARG